MTKINVTEYLYDVYVDQYIGTIGTIYWLKILIFNIFTMWLLFTYCSHTYKSGVKDGILKYCALGGVLQSEYYNVYDFVYGKGPLNMHI